MNAAAENSPSPRWAPQPGPQTDAIGADWCPELLYGGAAGGGKSDYLLGDWLQDVQTYEAAWQGVLFRRTYPELEELIARSREIYPQTGATWLEQKKIWTWTNGAVLRMRYLERETDATRYQGHQYTWIGWDEKGQWASPFAYRYLRARLRSAKPVPTKRIRSTANPGGAGHHWIKEYFIDPAPGGFTPLLDDATGMERMFIPSRLDDNRILLAHDPGYRGRLKGLGSPELVRAWLDGDWSVITGAFFPEWGNQHVVRPMPLPERWTRFRSLDWGSARPFSVGWWAISDGEMAQFPRGALIRYREWYGASAPNTGLRLPAEQVAQGIKARERAEKIAYGVADPAIFASDGGSSIAERMHREGVMFRAADNARVARSGAMGGWDQVRARLLGIDGRPMLYAFDTCRDLIRTLPALQHDQSRPEDVDTEGEDHAPDEARYACMSRPWVPPIRPTAPPRDRWDRRRPSEAEGSWKVA